MIRDEGLNKKDAAGILDLFDESINSKVRAIAPQSASERVAVRGTLDHFKCIDGLWHLRVQDATADGLGSQIEMSRVCVLADESGPNSKKRRLK